jgi:hypothetical protein
METGALKTFIDSHQRLFVLTGAGCSTNSGIPDYRDEDGNWKRALPVRFQAFVADETTRRPTGRAVWSAGGGSDKLCPTTGIAPWRGLKPEASARSCSPRTSTGCTRPLGAGR